MPTTMRPVRITAAGVVSPIGNSLGEVFDSLEKGHSALGPIRRFDASRLRTGIAGEVDLARLLASIGTTSIEVPFLVGPVDLARNPKLLFSLVACGQALGLDEGWIARRAVATSPEGEPGGGLGGRMSEAKGPPSRKIPPGSAAERATRSSPAAEGAPGRPTPGVPPWASEVALYTTAGLEEVELEALWTHERHGSPISSEVPPALVGEVVAWFLGLTAQPPVSMVSACASSTQSIGEAFRAVRHGAVEMALAGGADSMNHPYGINAFNSLGALSEGHGPECRLAPFDRSRSGTLLGEGAAFFLLESDESARRHGHEPLAEIVGYGSTMDAFHPVQPRPDGSAAGLAMERALADGAVSPAAVDYINAHGSGTYHNDVAEARAIGRVFEGRVEALKVSSTKPFHGHLLTAGGAMELLGLLFAFDRDLVPPTLNLSSPERGCDLDLVPGSAAPCRVETAMSNSFGLNGQNGVLVLRAGRKAS